MESELRVVDWVSSESLKPETKEAPVPTMGGFFGLCVTGHGHPKGKIEGQRWPDYLVNFKPISIPYLEALRKEIIAKKIRYTGEDHQDADDGVPVFSDGTVLMLSWRAWGDLMAAVWSTEENKDYCYMDFYMDRNPR